MEKLTRNMIWMAASNIVSSLFGIAVFIYLARTLLPEAFGYFSYVFTVIFFLSNFIDLGLSTFGMREIAKDRQRVSDYVSEIASFRLIIAILLSVFLVFTVFISWHPDKIKTLLLESIPMLFAFALATEWAFQGVEKMHMVLISFAVTSILQFLFICLLVKGPEHIFRTPLIYFCAMLPIIAVYLRHFRFRILLKASDMRRMMKYLSSSLVIWAISIFAQVYNSMDIFLLGIFRSVDEVGCFTIARRITGGAILLIVFIANAVLPRLSHVFGTDLEEFRAATGKFLRLAAILSIFVLLPAALLSRQIINYTVGDRYIAASGPLRVMILGLVLVLFNMPYSTGLIACRLEKAVLKQVIASAVLSVLLNVILMPLYGMMGAAISFVCAEALALIWILVVYARKIVKLLRKEGRIT